MGIRVAVRHMKNVTWALRIEFEVFPHVSPTKIAVFGIPHILTPNGPKVGLIVGIQPRSSHRSNHKWW